MVSCSVGAAIAVAWFVVSIFLTLEHAGATDTMPIDQPVPLWLKIGFAIALFPLRCLININQAPPGLSDHAAGEYFLLLMFLNSLFWGFLLVSFYQITARFFAKRHVEKTPS
jgi:hypothetical protein